MIGLVIFSLIGSPNQEREVCGKLARVEWSGTEGKASFEFDQYREYIIHDFGVYTDLKSTLGQQICVTVYGAILTEVKP